ncbi:MAG: ornithine carbamoyltransferase [Candidatus Margulisiibacteriota bacterium]
MEDLTSIKGLSSAEIDEIFRLSAELKKEPLNKTLQGKTVAMIFEKPSTRTRVSFETGIYQMGGHAVLLSDATVQLGKRETIADVGRTLSRYVNGIVIRTFEHEKVLELAKYSSVPVINALSDYSHPCQALADVFTLLEKKGNIKGLKLIFMGDGNNVARSLNVLCKRTGIKFVLCCPKGYEMEDCEISHDPTQAVKDADVIYTDVWTSMGQEKETKKRLKDFAKYQVNGKLLKNVEVGRDRPLLIMHCLPAHRGEEITDDVIDGPNSIVFDQAENRLHVQKAVMAMLMG